MKTRTTTTVPFRRRKEKKTNFCKRLAYIKSKLPRATVRISNKFIMVQIIKYMKTGDETIASATSKELSDFGWNTSKKNIPSAYLTGMLCGKRAKEKGENKSILDIGFHSKVKGARIFAAAKGVKDAGIEINISEESMPKEKRIKGKHISEEIEKNFDETKKNIIEKVSYNAKK